MARKYTMSKDGNKRTNVIVRLRITKKQLDMIEKLVKDRFNNGHNIEWNLSYLLENTLYDELEKLGMNFMDDAF